LLGAAPDSIVVVPPLDRLAAAPAAERDPLGLDQPAMGFVPPPSALATVAPADTPEAGLVDATAVETAPDAQAVPGPTAQQMPEREPALATSWWAQFPVGTEHPSGKPSRPEDAPAPGAQGEHVSAATAPSHADATARPVADQRMLAGFAPLRPQPGYDARSALDWSDTGAPETGDAISEARVSLTEAEPPPEVAVAAWAPTPASASTAVSAAGPEAPSPSVARGAAPALDDARIAEAVDEIRMQVLQRIDIFTDTTLRAKLGEQLQPLVERASAELVAAINQHVGDLLRTYVAEALEQEIERWRNSQR